MGGKSGRVVWGETGRVEGRACATHSSPPLAFPGIPYHNMGGQGRAGGHEGRDARYRGHERGSQSLCRRGGAGTVAAVLMLTSWLFSSIECASPLDVVDLTKDTFDEATVTPTFVKV